MWRRTTASGGGGLVVAVLLFLGMQALISRPPSDSLRRDAYPVIDFVRLAREEAPPPDARREPPPEPPPPENPPPTPSLALSSPQPRLAAPQLEMTTAPVRGPLLGMIPLAAPAAGQPAGPGLMNQELIALVRVPPRYPSRASRMQIEGFVTVEFTITKDGSVSDPVVIESSPPKIFDRAALRAIVQWKFKPRTRDGQAVDSRASQRINFALQEG